MRFSIIARINCNQQLTVREWKINFLVANSIIVGCRGLKMDIFEKSENDLQKLRVFGSYGSSSSMRNDFPKVNWKPLRVKVISNTIS